LAAERGEAFGVAFDTVPEVGLDDDAVGLAAARGVAVAGVNRSPMLGIAARGDVGGNVCGDAADAGFAGVLGDDVAGLSGTRVNAGRDVGAGRSSPLGGGLDSVTTECPLVQAALSTLKRARPTKKRCSQILPGLPSARTVANQLSESQVRSKYGGTVLGCLRTRRLKRKSLHVFVDAFLSNTSPRSAGHAPSGDPAEDERRIGAAESE
jgi:hypothetical protein